VPKIKKKNKPNEINVSFKLGSGELLDQNELSVVNSPSEIMFVNAVSAGAGKISYTMQCFRTLDAFLKGGVNKGQFFMVVLRFLDAVYYIGEKNLKINNLDLDLSDIAVTQNANLFFVYLPVVNPWRENNVFGFLYEMARNTFSSDEDKHFTERFDSFLRQQTDFSFERILEFVDVECPGLIETAGLKITGGSQSAAAPQAESGSDETVLLTDNAATGTSFTVPDTAAENEAQMQPQAIPQPVFDPIPQPSFDSIPQPQFNAVPQQVPDVSVTPVPAEDEIGETVLLTPEEANEDVMPASPAFPEQQNGYQSPEQAIPQPSFNSIPQPSFDPIPQPQFNAVPQQVPDASVAPAPAEDEFGETVLLTPEEANEDVIPASPVSPEQQNGYQSPEQAIPQPSFDPIPQPVVSNVTAPEEVPEDDGENPDFITQAFDEADLSNEQANIEKAFGGVSQPTFDESPAMNSFVSGETTVLSSNGAGDINSGNTVLLVQPNKAIKKLIINFPRLGKEVTVEGGEFKIGSDAAYCNFAIPNTNISRVHLFINYDGNDYYANDKGSTNGTVLNGTPLQRGVPVKLKSYDRLILANEVMNVQILED